MNRSPNAAPAVLALVNCLGLAVGLFGTRRFLPAELQTTLDFFPSATLDALKFFNPHLKETGRQYLSDATDYLAIQPSFWIWLLISLSASLACTLTIQLIWTGRNPGKRYAAGFATALGVNVVVCALLTRNGVSMVDGIPCATVSYFLAQFLGWSFVLGTPHGHRRQTDARTIQANLKFGRRFQPETYFDLKKGIFVGLERNHRPTYIPIAVARKHLQVLGESGSGKTVAVSVLLAQFARLKETVVVFDPKRDKHAPSVMKAAASAAGVRFIYIDLNPNQPPQFSILSGTSASEIEEILISCFDLSAKGSDADVYRVEDRAAARKLAHSGATTFGEMVAIGKNDGAITGARKFWEDLREVASHSVIETKDGWRLEELVGQPVVIYVAGSTRHDNTVRLQKMLLLRILQIIDRKGIKPQANWCALFIDEFKYLLSPAALQALGTIRDRNCHLAIAHQSLGDLRDVSGLDPHAVYGAVVVNTGWKVIYKANDPETIRFAASLSGQIPTYAEVISKDALTSRCRVSYQERTSHLIDENTLLALPPLTGMLYGAGEAKLLCVHYLPTSNEAPKVAQAPRFAMPVSDVEPI